MARRVALAALLLALGATRASAQPAAPPLVPPRAIDTRPVPYPAGASGEANVVLELLVDVEGNVQSARIVDGVEPFADAALRAASSFRFEPARRGDVTVAARIRMRVEFHPPAPEPPPEAENEAQRTPAPAAPPTHLTPASRGPLNPAPAPVEEVRVRGARHEAGETSMGGGEVRQMPGAFGDAFRAIEALPGVTPIISGLPYFFVRGAPPGNTGYFLDGVRVPLLYHLGFGPSVVHPALIDRVDFYPGGYPARFGRFAGGILSGETRPPATAPHGEGNVRIFDAGAVVEAPFADGKGTALAAGRYSYTALAISLVAPQTSLDYWDYQTRATWKLGDRDQIGVFAFGSSDFLGDKNERTGVTKTVLDTQFHRVDVRWDHDIGKTGKMRAAITAGYDKTATEDFSGIRDRMLGARIDLENRLSDEVRLRAGADVVFDHYDVDPGVPAASAVRSVYPPRNDLAAGLYADVVWRLGPRVEVIPGLRVDYFASERSDEAGPPGDRGKTNVPSIDPRIATRVRLTGAVTSISTFGISHQPPAFFVPVPGLQIGRLADGLQTSVQASQGAEIALPADVTATSTLFLHNYLGLTDFASTCSNTSSETGVDNCVNERVRGRTFGMELLVRRALTKRLTGWISYTLSRTTREEHPLALPGVGRNATILGEFDRTHVLNVIAAYDLGRGWRVGGRFFYYTGEPYSNHFHGVPIPPLNTERLPDFYRIDVRLEKRWRLGKQAWIAFVVEGLNVTLRQEATGVNCEPRPYNGPFPVISPLPLVLDKCTPEYIGPVAIPSLGVEAAF